MDGATDSDIPPIILESFARVFLGDRFDEEKYRKIADASGKVNRDLFLAELDRVDVYVSYDRSNSIDSIVRSISQCLIQKGLSIICEEGSQFKKIETGIRRSSCVVVFLTRSYLDRVNSGDEDDPCHLEFTYATREKKVSKIIPVCLEGSIQDPLCWIGAVGKMLAGRLCLDAYGDLQNDFYIQDRTDHLYERITKILAKHDCSSTSATLDSSRSLKTAYPNNPSLKKLCALDMEEVTQLLEYHNLSNYAEEFRDNQVDGECLSLCESPEDFKDMGIHLMPKARLLFSKISLYQQQGGVPAEVLRGAVGRRARDVDTELLRNRAARKRAIASASASTPSEYAVSRLQSLRVSGCVGERARDINGIYEPTEEKFDGFCRYLKKGGQNNWMEYNAARGHWHIKKAESKGSVNAWAYCMSSVLAPPDRIGGCWHVYNGSDFPEQSSLVVTTVYESLMVHGASRACSQPVNGIFDPTTEECGGWIRYRKRWGQHDCWMEYNEARGQWHIKPSVSKGTTHAWAYFTCRPVCSPDKCSGAVWHLYDGAKFSKQDSVIVIVEPVPVTIKGASGSCMQQVNGVFDPCADVYGGFVRYRKRGGQDCWMEYHEQRKQWHIKPDSSKTTTNAWAYAVYPKPMSPHLLRSVWHLYDGKMFEKQSEVLALPELKSVVISGAAGNVAPQVNGIFDPTDEICNGWVRYKKRGGQDCWMEYMESKGQWHIKPSASKNSTNAWAYASCRPVQAPHDIGDIWRLYDGSKFEDHPTVKVSAEETQEDRDLASWLNEISR